MPSDAIREIGFILLPRFSLAALGSALGVIEAVNDIANNAPIRVSIVGNIGQPLKSATQIAVIPASSIDDIVTLDIAIVIGDAPLPENGHDELIAKLKLADMHGVTLGGVGTGAWILARAGLLDGHRATIHWPYSGLFAERFPDVVVSSHIFEIDGKRLTAAGGQAAQDLLLALVTAHFGVDMTAGVMDHLGIERARSADERQRVPLSVHTGGGQPKLTEAVSLMEANFEEPLPTEEIARLVGVSRRQLERLFRQHLDSLPSRYYPEMRLARARQLLRETSQSILQIGLSCRFSSGSHFSSAYRGHFGMAPDDERSRRLVALPVAATEIRASGQKGNAN